MSKKSSTYSLWDKKGNKSTAVPTYYRTERMDNRGYVEDELNSSKSADDPQNTDNVEVTCNDSSEHNDPVENDNVSTESLQENVEDNINDSRVEPENNDTVDSEVTTIQNGNAIKEENEDIGKAPRQKRPREIGNLLAKHFVLVPAHLLKPAKDVDEADQLLDQGQANGGPKVLVDRSLFTQKNFDENFEAGSRPSPTLGQIVKKKINKCKCSGRCVRDFVFSIFPFIAIMKNYKVKEDLMGDVISGLTVGIMHIPQGMAYGMLTTLPPVYGLYMSFFPVLIYFFFGSSKHVSMGTFAVACLMIGSAVSKGMAAHHTVPAGSSSGLIPGNQSVLVDTMMVNQTNFTDNVNITTTMRPASDADEQMSAEELNLRLEFAMSVTFMVGVIQLLMGFFRLGFITVYLSDPLISGFTTGAACHVFTSQIKHIFGVKTNRYSGVFKLVWTYRDFFTNIETTNIVTLLLSVVCVVILYCTGRFINQNPKLKPKMFMPVPIELIMVVLGTLTSYLIRLNEDHNVVIVSDIPTGLPVPNLKGFSRIDEVISDAIALAIVIFAISISMGKLLAKKHDYEVDANQELVAYGISTVISSFLSSAAPSASLSRSLVQERVGGRTQVAGLVSCCLLLVVLLAIGPYFRTLPNCVLASIIIVALRGMFLQVLDLKKLWSVSLIDFFVWIVSFLATVLLDVDLGLGVAVIFNILTVVCRSQRPYATLLGQIPGTDIYRDMNVYQEAREVVGVKIFRFEHSLFFVNTEHFKTLLYKRTINPRTLKIIMKKREAKLEKQKKKDQLTLVGENAPDVAVPTEMMEMELDTTGGEVKVAIIGMDKLKPLPSVDFHTIVIDCSPWSFVDSMGVKVLTAVIGEYKAVGVKVILANCKGGVREMFEKTKFYDTLDHNSIYVSLHDAVIHALHLESPTTEIPDSGRANGTRQRDGSMIEGSQRDGSYMDGSENIEDYNIDFVDDESVKGGKGRQEKLLGKSKA